MATTPKPLSQNPDADRLREWLANKPFEWGPALALRSTIRALPFALTDNAPTEWVHRYALPILHGLFVAWSTHTRQIKGHKLSAELSANLLSPAALSPEPEAFFASGVRAISLAIASNEKEHKINHSVRSVMASQSLFVARGESRFSDNFIWQHLEIDVGRLSASGQIRNSYSRKLLLEPILAAPTDARWRDFLEQGLGRLINIESSFSVWRPWVLAIALSRNLNFFNESGMADARTRDLQAARQIIQTLEPAFWQRRPSQVNSDVENWIVTAAEGGLQGPADVVHVPPQNENAISFQTDSSGKIGLSNTTFIDRVRDNQDTLDRYDECLNTAREVLDRCKGSNSAIRIVRIMENYIEAAGSSISEVRPSLLVQRGERLRQELAAYQSPDTMLAPIPDDILLDLRAWQSAHNMLVGLDPALMARDTVQLGPDSRVADVPPQEIKQIAVAAESAGLLADDVVDVVIEAAALAPTDPDPTNRRTVWSFETGRNLVIEAFNLAMRHPGKAATGAMVSGIVLPSMGLAGAVASATAGALPAAKFLLSHREWIETRLGDSPTWKGLFVSLCDWLENNTPLNTGSDKK